MKTSAARVAACAGAEWSSISVPKLTFGPLTSNPELSFSEAEESGCSPLSASSGCCQHFWALSAAGWLSNRKFCQLQDFFFLTKNKSFPGNCSSREKVASSVFPFLTVYGREVIVC